MKPAAAREGEYPSRSIVVAKRGGLAIRYEHELDGGAGGRVVSGSEDWNIWETRLVRKSLVNLAVLDLFLSTVDRQV